MGLDWSNGLGSREQPRLGLRHRKTGANRVRTRSRRVTTHQSRGPTALAQEQHERLSEEKMDQTRSEYGVKCLRVCNCTCHYLYRADSVILFSSNLELSSYKLYVHCTSHVSAIMTISMRLSLRLERCRRQAQL